MFAANVAVIIYLIGRVSMQTDVCNPISCFSHLNSLFELQDLEDPCLKILRLEKCIASCSTKEQNVLVEGLQAVKLDICEDPSSKMLSNKCESKHKFALFSCLYESLTLESLDPTVNESMVICRQASEGERCDLSSMPQCTAHSNYLSGVLLESFFKPLRRKHCLFSINDVYTLKLKPSLSAPRYQKLAECLDKSGQYITECIPHKWVTPNFLIGAHFGKEFCKVTQSFMNCIQGVVRNKCKAMETTFESISQNLFEYTMPQCTENQLLLKTQGSVKSNDEFSETSTLIPQPLQDSKKAAVLKLESEESVENATLPTSTPQPLNSSKAVVVHQNVFISVNYHDVVFSAASIVNICNAYLLTIFGLLFWYFSVRN